MENADGYLLHQAAMVWIWDHYAPASEHRADPHAAPMLAADHSGLPPALVLTMEFDPLRDEGEAYAAKLREAGVAVRTRRHDGLIHGTLWAAAAIPRSQELFDEIAAFIAER